MNDWFKTIDEHWAHFLERDIPANAPDVQVMAMKRAFAAGAVSGIQLAMLVSQGVSDRNILEHVKDIKALCGERTP